MTGFVLQRPVSVLGWELRGALASGRIVRLVLDGRCDGVLVNEWGDRILEGRVQRVAATDAYCVVQGRHVPLDAILAVHRTHFRQAAASDPADPMGRPADYTDAPLAAGASDERRRR